VADIQQRGGSEFILIAVGFLGVLSARVCQIVFLGRAGRIFQGAMRRSRPLLRGRRQGLRHTYSLCLG